MKFLFLALPAVLLSCAPGSDDRPRSGATTETHTATRLNPDRVPAELRHLVHLAERWGIGDDVERIAAVDRATPAERAELEQAVTPVSDRITAWLDSFGQTVMPDEAAAFMYMQLALEEMRAGRR
ncbi:MAG TPA: hypothetical protein VFB46_09380 [Gemmatimonadaceae bacterium]|nr:hypothetical protein [Gemmatimonadaceae bacterium]